MDLEHVAREDEALDAGTATGKPERKPSVVWSWDDWDERNLPVEPEPAAAAEADPARTLQELRAFHRYGRRPSGGTEAGERGSMPALLHRFRDLNRVRHEYPLCVDGPDPATAIRPLSEWTDQVLAEHAATGDAGEQLRHHVYRLESVVRTLAAEKDGERLSVMWDRAAATLLETSGLSADKEKVLRENIALAKKALAADAELVSCGPHAAERMLRASAGVFWRERCGRWSEELDALIRQLNDILAADFSQSEAAKAPAHLRESLGAAADDVDVQAMSALLSARKSESALPPERRRRIEAILATLTRMQPVFAPHTAARGREPIAMRVDAVLEDCAAAVDEQRSRLADMTEFFRAVRVARLEIQNQYRPDIHDPFFAGFDERYLTEDETALCPPVLVRLTDEQLSHAEIGVLLGILNANAPIKILLELRALYDALGPAELPRLRFSGAARLASMAMALHHVYVLQAPLSRASALRARLLDGLRYGGPALFCVYAPAAADGPARATYLRAAAAAESRFFPVLVFDPAKGETLAERFDLAENAQCERAWPADTIAYRKAGGEEASLEIAFTPVDFLFCDRRLAGHFWELPAGRAHNSLVPVHEYLGMDEAQAAGRIPYVLTVDRDGRLGRAVVTRALVEAAWQCGAFWRGVQESGGIENSFAKRLVAVERERLEADKEREVEAIEKNYLAQLDQDVGELTREIVQRIAGQLMGAEGVAFVARPAVSAAPAAAPAATAAAAAPATAKVEEEEAAVSFDDPYIDTPLCTSCNECTKLNPRMFAYNANKQAEVKDATTGSFSELVRAAELCPVHIIHPGKPKNPNEPGLPDLVARAARFN